jgi:hypothetical protein
MNVFWRHPGCVYLLLYSLKLHVFYEKKSGKEKAPRFSAYIGSGVFVNHTLCTIVISLKFEYSQCMIEINGIIWNEAMLRRLIDDSKEDKSAIQDLKIQSTARAVEVVRLRIELSRQSEAMKKQESELGSLRSQSVRDANRVRDAISNERMWRAQAIQLRYELNAKEETADVVLINKSIKA